MDKDQLRREYLQKRRSLSPQDLERANKSIRERLQAFLPWKQLKAIHLYLPIETNNEVDTWKFIQYVRTYYPEIDLVIPKIAPDKNLQHFLLEENTPLKPNRWNIPEPVSGSRYEIKALDAILVPLLAFDKLGHRLGYGQGYYDRFLALCPQIHKIGLSLFPPLIKIPVSTTDIRMNAVITPESTFRFD